MITTIKDFLEACKGKSAGQIEDIFDLQIDDNTYVCIMSRADDEADDPMKSALNMLGKEYNIQSLVDY